MTQSPRLSKSGFDITPYSREKVAELAKKLDPDAYRITQKAGTESPFCGTLLDNKKIGVYVCVVCGLPLFPVNRSSIRARVGRVSSRNLTANMWPDTKIARQACFGQRSIARCGAHLGHVFDDGPEPTGERHCLNSASLKFYEEGEKRPPESMPVAAAMSSSAAQSAPGTAPGSVAGLETAYFAGGCFWGVEHYFQKGAGVIDAVSGYMQGTTDKPTYKEICAGKTGHAETVKVVFDPQMITYRRLLEAFFVMHDPTQFNRQGPDVGDQYRSGIWYTSETQKKQAEAFIAEQAEKKAFGGKKIVTQVEAAKTFFPAETYIRITSSTPAAHVM